MQPDCVFLPPDRQERFDYYPVANDTAALFIFIHGGGWVSGDKRKQREQNIAAVLNQNGIAVISSNYHLATSPHKSYFANCVASYPQNVEDVGAIVTFAHEHSEALNIDPNRIALGGASAGAHLALLAATRATLPLKALVLLYGLYDWSTYNGAQPSDPRAGQRYPTNLQTMLTTCSPIHHLEAQHPPIWSITGTADEEIHHNQSEALEAHCKELGRPHDIFEYAPGARHSFDFSLTSFDIPQSVLPFLRRHLNA